MRRWFSICLLLALLVAAGCSDDPTEPPPPGSASPKTLSASKDNTLYEDAVGTWSNGAGHYFFVGKTSASGSSGEPAEIRRAVIAFDIAAVIPAGSTIDSVFLTLTMDKATQDPTGRNVTLHPLLANWGEGASFPLLNPNEGGGAPADTMDATWIHRFYSDSLWTNPGGDFDAIASAVRVVANIGTYTWGSTAAMVGEVQTWLDNPGINYGWILIGDESTDPTAKRFRSRSNPATSARPKLIVYFTEP